MGSWAQVAYTDGWLGAYGADLGAQVAYADGRFGAFGAQVAYDDGSLG